MEAVPEGGEVLVRRRWRKSSDGLPVPMQLQVLEADFLDEEKHGPNGANEIIQGIEFSPIGKRVAYWLSISTQAPTTPGAHRPPAASRPRT